MSRFVRTLAPREFTTVRTFACPRAVVFDAWLDPVRLSSWFGPRGFSAPLASIANDPRPGGRWNVTLVDDSTGLPYPCSYTYSEVTPPERIIFMDRKPGRIDGRATVNDVTFTEVDGATEMVFHSGHPDPRPEYADAEEDWESSFDKLAELLAAH